MTFESQNVILYVPRMFLSDVDIPPTYVRYHVFMCAQTYVYMYVDRRLWDLENEIDFLVVLYFCFIKRHVETVTFLPKLVNPFFQMVKYLFFLDLTNICTSLYIYSGVRKLEFDKLIDKLFF